MPPKVLHGLDRDVYQIIVKYEDDHFQNGGGKLPKFTVSGVYDWIKRSNSSLARQKKRPLEDSIEKVLRLRKEERVEHDEEAALDAQPAQDTPQVKERDYFLMNKQITKQWNIPKREANPASAEATTSTGSDHPLAERQSNGEPKPKRKRTERAQEDRSPPTHITVEDLGGMDDALEILGEAIAFPILFPGLCAEMDFQGARGILLHGPPGCGKTMLANAFAAELGVPFISVSAPSLIAGMSGESEKKIRELYDEAKKLAPCLVFIDEIDAIMGKRENAQREMEKRIVAQMLTCMDDLNPETMGNKVVATLAATNRPDSIDPALRRAGRFNREISLGIPNEASREAILSKLVSKSRLAEDVDVKQLAKRTPGFVGADLKDVVNVAKNDMARGLMAAITQSTASDMDVDSEKPPARGVQFIRGLKAVVDEEFPHETVQLSMQHLTNAIAKVQPSSKREGFSTIPDTTWAHVGALEDVREQLELSIVQPIQDPEFFAELGLANATSGVILWGPPGCGKTLLAKAVANESKANFISVKGPELLNKYVGESERSVRQVFSRALASAPCILFFDELDALVPRRDSGVGVDASARVVNQLLTELDGMDSRAGVYVVGATNRPDMIDPAILRPGRLGKHVFVDLPSADGRVDILQRRIQRLQPKASTVDGWAEQITRVARDPRCEGFSGADMDNLHIAAGEAAYKRCKLDRMAQRAVTDADWEQALATVKPSVSGSHADKFRVLKQIGWE